jgi:nucleotide-binding universal stress UspA family protein
VPGVSPDKLSKNNEGDKEGNRMRSGTLEFKTIVVATDLSDAASCALRYAQAMARMYDSTVVIVHVIDPLAYAFGDPATSPVPPNTSAAEEVRKMEAETVAQGIPVHSIVERGMICGRILQAVEDHRGDLLVLGTQGKTEAGRMALGRVARQLLARCPCPIMTISPEAAGQGLPYAGCWPRVLAATDFCAASIGALHCAHQVALRQLILVHVTGKKQEKERSHLREKLRYLAPFNESHTVPVEHLVISGDPGVAIADMAKKYAVSLVVIGSPEDELREQDFRKSTVLQVVSRVRCPVLCLPFVHAPAVVEGVHAGAVT